MTVSVLGNWRDLYLQLFFSDSQRETRELGPRKRAEAIERGQEESLEHGTSPFPGLETLPMNIYIFNLLFILCRCLHLK